MFHETSMMACWIGDNYCILTCRMTPRTQLSFAVVELIMMIIEYSHQGKSLPTPDVKQPETVSSFKTRKQEPERDGEDTYRVWSHCAGGHHPPKRLSEGTLNLLTIGSQPPPFLGWTWTSSVFVQPPQFTRHHAKRKVKGLFEIEMNPAIYFCVERKDEEGSIWSSSGSIPWLKLLPSSCLLLFLQLYYSRGVTLLLVESFSSWLLARLHQRHRSPLSSIQEPQAYIQSLPTLSASKPDHPCLK